VKSKVKRRGYKMDEAAWSKKRVQDRTGNTLSGKKNNTARREKKNRRFLCWVRERKSGRETGKPLKLFLYIRNGLPRVGGEREGESEGPPAGLRTME